MKKTLLLISLILSTCTAKRDVSNIKMYSVGDTKVAILDRCRYPCSNRVLYINLHHNERTSVKAAEQYLSKIGGRIINIENNGDRLVQFSYKGESYTFDPNRIFSSAGVDSTITLLSARYNANAALEVSKFAKHLIKNYIENCNLIISLHNNLDSSLSVFSYQQAQHVNEGSGKVFINPAMDADDFILTTDTTFFKVIKEKNINIVWENADAIKDDGSLSVYAAYHKIPYINVEAQHEHSEEQLRMLKVLDEIIEAYDEEKVEKSKKL